MLIILFRKMNVSFSFLPIFLPFSTSSLQIPSSPKSNLWSLISLTSHNNKLHCDPASVVLHSVIMPLPPGLFPHVHFNSFDKHSISKPHEHKLSCSRSHPALFFHLYLALAFITSPCLDSAVCSFHCFLHMVAHSLLFFTELADVPGTTTGIRDTAINKPDSSFKQLSF